MPIINGIEFHKNFMFVNEELENPIHIKKSKEIIPKRTYGKQQFIIPMTCMLCGKVELKKKKLTCDFRCKECKPVWKSFSNKKRLSIRKYGLNVLSLDLSKCNICGFIHLIDIHHKDFNKQNNELSNLICLCPNCHMLIHRHKFTLEQLEAGVLINT